MKKSTTRKQTAEKKEPGRPSKYSVALADRICDHIRCGCSLRKAAEKEGVSAPTVMNWVHENRTFSEQYARACEERLAALEDKLLDLCEKGHEVAPRFEIGGTMLQAVKLEIDTLKWMLSKLMPKKYGDRKAVELTGANGGPVEMITDHDEVRIASVMDRIEEIRRKRAEEDHGGTV